MRKIRTWQLCRTGTFGQDGASITEKDLQEIMETFTPTRPISIGHDMARTDNFPKFGDVLVLEGIKDEGYQKVLIGQVVLHPQMDALYDDGDGNGVYKGWSVTIPRRASDGKRYLHSLAITGMVPPKIPGLQEILVKSSYNDGDKVEVFTFNENLLYKENIMTDEEKKKMENLEAEVKRLKEELAKKAQEENKVNRESEKKVEPPSFNEDLQKRLEIAESELKKNKVERFCDSVKDKIPVGLFENVRSLGSALVDVQDINYSDKDSKKTATALELLQSILSGWPQMQGRQLYNFSDDSNKDDKKNQTNDWAQIAKKL